MTEIQNDTPTAIRRYTQLVQLTKERLVYSRALIERRENTITLEFVALCLRKIIEGVAHACLISCELRTGNVPRQVKGHWSAEYIIDYLNQRNLLQMPRCARFRAGLEGDPHGLDIYAGANDLIPWLLHMYSELHKLMHEFNPYNDWIVFDGRAKAELERAWNGAAEYHKDLWNWLWVHAVELGDAAYLIQMGAADHTGIAVTDLQKLVPGETGPQPADFGDAWRSD